MRHAMAVLLGAGILMAESAAGVRWTAPEGWVSKGSAPMRAATYTVQDAECVVYYFGPGQGGSVEANIARWNGQFTRNGQPAAAKTGKKTVHGLPVTEMEVAGTYSGMAGPAMTPQAPKSEQRMLAAIVEAAGGNLFVKFTGPEKTVSGNRDKFERMIESFRKE